MKKFKFTLKAVYEYKQTVEKTQKADLSRAEEMLRMLRQREQELIQAFEHNSALRDAALEKRVGVISELEKIDAYFRRLREEREELAVKIKKAEVARDSCRELLIITMKEIKTYAKLEQEQYQRYLKEVAEEEEKEMSDIVSFSAATNND